MISGTLALLWPQFRLHLELVSDLSASRFNGVLLSLCALAFIDGQRVFVGHV